MSKDLVANMKSTLASHRSRISYSTDVWTSPTSVPFLGLTAHYIDPEWNLHCDVLALRHIPGSHTGVRMASVILSILADFELLGRTLFFTVDNASNNDTMIAELIRVNELRDLEAHIRCFAHVLNLAVQSSLIDVIDKVDNLREAIKLIK